MLREPRVWFQARIILKTYSTCDSAWRLPTSRDVAENLDYLAAGPGKIDAEKLAAKLDMFHLSFCPNNDWYYETSLQNYTIKRWGARHSRWSKLNVLWGRLCQRTRLGSASLTYSLLKTHLADKFEVIQQLSKTDLTHYHTKSYFLFN